ncbi:hypothetical protein [Burkholderia cepacia]|uniref:hypothetical protein n=1 Tax=Burkholderia cepacia TaxID=292 RepID=UPI0012D96C7E|nr:hypothetical protein [Burkholderia cepacia]
MKLWPVQTASILNSSVYCRFGTDFSDMHPPYKREINKIPAVREIEAGIILILLRVMGTTLSHSFLFYDTVRLTTTYASMVTALYGKYPRRLVPSIRQFLYHARTRLLAQQDAARRRLGPRLATQYAKPRIGQASHMTFGFNLEVVDIDGFVAKIPAAALINKKVEPVFVTIIFAVSRRTVHCFYQLRLDH